MVTAPHLAVNPALVAQVVSQQRQDAQLAFAVILRREDFILNRIVTEMEREGRPSAHWNAAENLGIETYAIAKRCRWTRPDGKPDTARARAAMDVLCAENLTIIVMRSAYPVRTYYISLSLLRQVERERRH